MITALLFLSNAQATDVVWTGIDYGQVHMVGTLDFNEPYSIFPGYLNRWNGLFLSEMMPLLNKRLRAHVSSSTSHLAGLHKIPDPKEQIVRDDTISIDEAFLAPEDIAERVTTYELTAMEGIGLTFIADQLNKPAQKACYWVTFYDIESRKVLGTSRRCGAARGFGFRNYWFGTVKAIVDEMDKRDVPR